MVVIQVIALEHIFQWNPFQILQGGQPEALFCVGQSEWHFWISEGGRTVPKY